MAGTFKFELISPEEKLISEDVAMVTVPGEEGEFGVLAGHSPLLSSVRAGVVHIHKSALNDNPRRVFVAGGFADVGPDHCTLLAEEAHDLAFVDVHALEAEIHELSGLAAAVGEHERAAVEKRLGIARAKRAAL